ncbi:hypothetical protein [Thiothrix subterranea]|uniref:hypothetical protein n=1 Tax=Thiothrix subterranea TaxID=2735563 RepID=UPI00280B280E|nr:hypothetical protein [Thiothrix subterranea]
MKVAAAVYTLASVVVLALMVMRPAVNINSPAQETAPPPAPEAATSTTMPAAPPAPVPAPSEQTLPEEKKMM